MKKLYSKIIVVLAVLVLGGAAAYFYSKHSKKLKVDAPDASSQDAEIQQFHDAYAAKVQQQSLVPAIDGEMVSASEVRRPFAVSVENHPDSRPQSGLSQADIVYEALAEGGITRFLAIFQTQKVNNIGPVRSDRTYFNDWASELGAVLVHVGGNSDALYYLHQGVPGVFDADQFYNEQYFWRTKTRRAPHNVYTSTAELNQFMADKNVDMGKNYIDYTFKDDAPAAVPTAQNINIQFSTPLFAVKYIYDPATNTYKRYNAGVPAIDAGNHQQIEPKNVVVQIVRNWPVKSDTLLAISMGTREGGDAYVFQDGKEIAGTWKLVSGRTKFFDKQGNEIALNRGQTWIEIVPPEFESQLAWK